MYQEQLSKVVLNPKFLRTNGQMCFIQGRLIMLPIKKILFPSFFGVYLISFFFFNNFGKRIKECYITKEERVLKTYKFRAQGQD
jgi:hypothetical protein